MATLTIPYTFTNGATVVAAEHNANFTAVKNFAESLSAGGNFDAGAINTEDIAATAITTAKLASGAVTTAKLASSLALTTPDIGVATGTSLNCTQNVVYHITQNQTIGAYSLVLADDGRLVEMNNASGTTLTVPLNSSVAFPVGTQITILQTGAGQTTLAGAVGVTVNATPGLKLRAQWSAATLIKRGTDTWVAIGDLAA